MTKGTDDLRLRLETKWRNSRTEDEELERILSGGCIACMGIAEHVPNCPALNLCELEEIMDKMTGFEF